MRLSSPVAKATGSIGRPRDAAPTRPGSRSNLYPFWCPSPPYPMAVEHTRNDSAVNCRTGVIVILGRRVVRPRPSLRLAPVRSTLWESQKMRLDHSRTLSASPAPNPPTASAFPAPPGAAEGCGRPSSRASLCAVALKIPDPQGLLTVQRTRQRAAETTTAQANQSRDRLDALDIVCAGSIRSLPRGGPDVPRDAAPGLSAIPRTRFSRLFNDFRERI